MMEAYNKGFSAKKWEMLFLLQKNLMKQKFYFHNLNGLQISFNGSVFILFLQNYYEQSNCQNFKRFLKTIQP